MQVGHNGYFAIGQAGGFAHDFGVLLVEFGGAVAEVETDDIQAAYVNHVAQQLNIIAGGAKGGDDFGVMADAGGIALSGHGGSLRDNLK